MAVSYKKGNVFVNFYGTNAERIALEGMETNDKFKTSDTLKTYAYTGTAWILDENEVNLNPGDIEIGKVVIQSNDMELYGADTSTRPLATAVTVGTSFVVIADPMVIYMSDGTSWVEV